MRLFIFANICSLRGLLISAVSFQATVLFFSLPVLHFSSDLFVASCFPSLFLPSSFIIAVLFFPPRASRSCTDNKKRCSDSLQLFHKSRKYKYTFLPIDRYGTSIFSCAYNISVSASHNAPLEITIRPNNNIMEPVKHTHTNNTPLTNCFVSQNKRI